MNRLALAHVLCALREAAACSGVASVSTGVCCTTGCGQSRLQCAETDDVCKVWHATVRVGCDLECRRRRLGDVVVLQPCAMQLTVYVPETPL